MYSQKIGPNFDGVWQKGGIDYEAADAALVQQRMFQEITFFGVVEGTGYIDTPMTLPPASTMVKGQ